ncbi:SLC13 family permease [Jiella avicenniae]|uniref:Cation transporter n=1 Tax=Jiella avicenniae TaxID=2907202 RepID=A0A9X1T6S8_9HYPH|nr:SLC13 family permease [Jiella avicenniae]MCE7030159.1 cation transporter [Jiella avicenniae]
MTTEQAAVVVLMVALLAAFALDRFRIELVALCGLAVGAGLGLVPAGSVFSGFSSPAVLTVAEILIIVQLLVRSHLVDWLAEGLAKRLHTETAVLAAVCCLGAGLSVFMNNIGALALMLPLTFSLCHATGTRPGTVVMPLSFATLLGGTCSLVGTPANLVVSGFTRDAVAAPFGFFETATVGGAAAIAGVAYLCLFSGRILSERGLGAAKPDIAGPRHFVAEFRIPEGSSLVGLGLGEFEARMAGTVHSQLRDDRHVFGRREARRIFAGDVLLAETDVATAMELGRKGEAEMLPGRGAGAEREWIEAVVLPQSVVVGTAAGNIAAFERYGVDLVAVSPQARRIEGRLADVSLSVGDVFLLRGDPAAVREALAEVDCLAVTPRGFGAPEPEGWITVAAFAAAVAASALDLLTPEVAFGLAVLVLALAGVVRLRQAVADLNWPILIMLAAMIPLGTAVETTGAADVIAHGLLAASGASGPWGVALVVLAATILVTPFVNNVSAAVALAPVAIAMGRSAGVPIEPLLLLVAVGASLDFATPFGHHNNTLAMGIGGYRFGDFVRLGLPLTVLAGLAALAAAMLAG